MYTVDSFGRMIADPARSTAYAEALRRCVRPGDVVVDLGAGTGAFSLLACRLGAGRVYAIESNPAIAIARESAAVNGFLDRMVLVEMMSTSVELPERADVLISDLRGTLPLHEGHLASIIDARTRFLRPGGTQIPIADELWIAPVFDPIAHGELTDPWSAFGLDMSAAIPYAVNTLQRRSISQDDVVAEPKQWATIDYRTVEHPSVAGSAVWNFERPVEIDGLGLWFKAFIMDDLSYSTSPFEPSTVYGMVYAPLADRMSIGAGDSLRVRVRGGPGGRFVRLDLEHRPRIQRSVSLVSPVHLSFDAASARRSRRT